MNFVWRINYINDKGVCIIGMDKIALLPLIIFEVVVNVIAPLPKPFHPVYPNTSH
jgi:hypothetical protein